MIGCDLLRRALACGFFVCQLSAVTRVGQAAEPAIFVFDRIGADALTTQKAPGFSFVVVHDGRVIYVKAFGLSDVERGIPVEANTPFAIGSMTKAFTAAAILLLAQRGELNLDDPLVKYLPTFPNASAITLRMLLNQTSGLKNYPTMGEHPWPLTGSIKLDLILSFLAMDQPDFAPGTQWEYSNANYTVLSGVIAKVGVDEAAFLQRNFFDPLKMTSSSYGYNAQLVAGLAKPYRGTGPFQTQSPISLDLYAGAGAIISNAFDIAAWDIALMSSKLLDVESTRAMWTAGKLANGTSVGYAMGFVPTTLAGHRELWHNGLAPGAGGYCYNVIFPDDELAIVVLSNGANFDGVPEQMAARVLAAYYPSAETQMTPIASPTPAPGEVPTATDRAKDWWHRLQTGTVDLSQVTPRFAQRLTPEFLAQVKMELEGQGTPTDWIYLGSRTVEGVTIYNYWIRLGGVAHVWSVGLTSDGKIAGSQLR